MTKRECLVVDVDTILASIGYAGSLDEVEALRVKHLGKQGDISALLAKCTKFETAITERRRKLEEVGKDIQRLRATSKFEEAAGLLEQADSIERGLDWIATWRKEVAAQIVARDAAIQAAIQAAPEIEQLVRQGKYRPARDLLDSHQRSLAAAAPGIAVKELQAADQFWSARKLRRSRLQLSAAVAFLMLLIAYEWQRRDLVAQARQLEAKLDESLNRTTIPTGIGAAEYANAARPLLNALQERNESAAAFGLWWLVAARSSELESEIAVVDSLLNLQSRPDSLDHAGAQYLELRRASVLERVQTAAAVGDVVMLRSLAQTYTALIKDASAIRDWAEDMQAKHLLVHGKNDALLDVDFDLYANPTCMINFQDFEDLAARMSPQAQNILSGLNSTNSYVDTLVYWIRALSIPKEVSGERIGAKELKETYMNLSGSQQDQVDLLPPQEAKSLLRKLGKPRPQPTES
jgi:hypothetical protein